MALAFDCQFTWKGIELANLDQLISIWDDAKFWFYSFVYGANTPASLQWIIFDKTSISKGPLNEDPWAIGEDWLVVFLLSAHFRPAYLSPFMPFPGLVISFPCIIQVLEATHWPKTLCELCSLHETNSHCCPPASSMRWSLRLCVIPVNAMEDQSFYTGSFTPNEI